MAEPAAPQLELSVLAGAFAVCRLPAGSALPPWFQPGPFATASWTADEVSLVCPQAQVPLDAQVRCERDWCCLALHGPIPFQSTGILLRILQPLARAAIGIFAISTFDTDYVLVKQASLEAAIDALVGDGHRVERHAG